MNGRPAFVAEVNRGLGGENTAEGLPALNVQRSLQKGALGGVWLSLWLSAQIERERTGLSAIGRAPVAFAKLSTLAYCPRFARRFNRNSVFQKYFLLAGLLLCMGLFFKI